MNLYMFIDKDRQPLYIGKTTKTTKERIVGHFSADGHLPLGLFEEYENIIHMECDNEYELMIKEIIYIGKYKPKYNRQFMIKDNMPKSMLCVIEDDRWTEFANKKDLIHKTQYKIEQIKIKEKEMEIYKTAMRKLSDEALSKHICLL